MVKSFRLWVLRKKMLKKDKEIRKYMMKKYTPHALKTIVLAGIRKISVDEEMINSHGRRINFINNHMKHTRMVKELDDMILE